uniref:Uncharacterized protein n=1 Tax=Glossina austeni TaxID=7395 RepID=A0A1A9UVX9_GLOAU
MQRTTHRIMIAITLIEQTRLTTPYGKLCIRPSVRPTASQQFMRALLDSSLAAYLAQFNFFANLMRAHHDSKDIDALRGKGRTSAILQTLTQRNYTLLSRWYDMTPVGIHTLITGSHPHKVVQPPGYAIPKLGRWARNGRKDIFRILMSVEDEVYLKECMATFYPTDSHISASYLPIFRETEAYIT